MSDTDSFFSCIKPAAAEAADDGGPLRRPPPPPAFPGAEAAGETREREARVKKAEDAAAAAERRVAELEKLAVVLKRELEDMRNAVIEAQEGHAASVLRLKAGIAGLDLRVAAAEKSASKRPPKDENPDLTEIPGLARCLDELEARINEDVSRRISGLDGALRAAVTKSLLAQEAAEGNTSRLERLEECTARLAYIENRFKSGERKFERICECEALVESLKVAVEEFGKSLDDMRHRESSLTGEAKRTASEVRALSRQVSQVSALLNHFRSELSFLMPGKGNTAGG